MERGVCMREDALIQSEESSDSQPFSQFLPFSTTENDTVLCVKQMDDKTYCIEHGTISNIS